MIIGKTGYKALYRYRTESQLVKMVSQLVKQKDLVSDKGFAVVELVIVLALLLVILPVIFAFVNLVQKGYSNADAKARVIEKVNIALMEIERDIRAASKPNKLTNPIVIHPGTEEFAKGQRMDIYYYNEKENKYYRIGYRLLPSDKTKLQRGWVECATSIPPDNVENPLYGEIIDDPSDYESGEGGKWKTILDGVRHKDNGIDIEIFKDITGDMSSERRKIKVTLIVNDIEKPMEFPITIDKVLTSRTKGVPEQ